MNLDKTAIGKAWAPAKVKEKLGNYPILAQQAAATIPQVKLVALKGVGHIPHIEKPKAFYHALLPFLAHPQTQEKDFGY
jgi:hypothetical protein